MMKPGRIRRHWSGSGIVAALAFAVVSGSLVGAEQEPSPEEMALEIIEETQVRGGLIVHVGSGDGRLTAALGAAGSSYLVQGLDTDPLRVAAARAWIGAQGQYGRVCVTLWDGKTLPYADGLVNLVLVSPRQTIPKSEVLRVLAPGGAVCAKRDGRWMVRRKPWPEDIDQWTHYLCHASNNAVARDQRVGPPRRLQWTCGPQWSRSHEFNSSLVAMVSAGGRLFYIFDEGLTGVTTPSLPERWTLVARDAFSGVLLWKRPLDDWKAKRWGSGALRSIPRTVPARLVASGDRVFITLTPDGPVSALDGATGRLLTTYAQTAGAEEIRCLDGILGVRLRDQRVVVLGAMDGRTLWEEPAAVRPGLMALWERRVFYQDRQTLSCRRLEDGQAIWQVDAERPAALMVVGQGRVLLAGGRRLWAVAADSGKTLWSVKTRVERGELFVAQGRVWHWQQGRLVGRDLEKGQVVTRLETDDVFTPGHHLRCYSTKATQRYLITPNRGAEFVSLTGSANVQNDWIRGACRYGVMPSNGLLYVTPHPCFCYPGVLLTGFNALATASGEPLQTGRSGRLQRGPAYDELGTLNPQPSGDWPTYRHDGRRTGATPRAVGARIERLWQAQLGGRLTPPVAAAGRLYVAAKDHHTLYAVSQEDGRPLWRFVADGPIDSPPTVSGQAVWFGCSNGWVYCLRAADGGLVWRFRAAPTERRIVAFGQLESPWPVHGSVLLENGVLYAAAGRSTYLDGGIWLVALDPATGRLLHQTRLDTWARTRQDARDKPFIPGYHMEGAKSDILVSQNGFIYLGQYKFDLQLVPQDVPYVMPDPDDRTVAMDPRKEPYSADDQEPDGQYEKRQRDWLERTQKDLLARLRSRYKGYSLGQRQMGLHLLTTAGFLDDSWFNRTYWMYSASWPGYYLAHRAAKTGQLLVVGPEKTYAIQVYPSRNFQSPLFTPGERGYLLLADRNDNEPVLDYRTRGTTKGWGYTRMAPPEWYAWLPIRVRAMVLAGEHLFVVGPPDRVDPEDPMATFEGRRGSVLRVLSAADGRTLAEYRLPSAPVFDGLIAAGGRLYMTTTDGQVFCVGEKQ